MPEDGVITAKEQKSSSTDAKSLYPKLQLDDYEPKISPPRYLSNKAVALMGTTSRTIFLQTPEPRAFEVFYEYRRLGSGNKARVMIRLTNGWSDVAEQLDLVHGNVVRFNKCDNLIDCFHIKQIEVVNLDFHLL